MCNLISASRLFPAPPLHLSRFLSTRSGKGRQHASIERETFSSPFFACFFLFQPVKKETKRIKEKRKKTTRIRIDCFALPSFFLLGPFRSLVADDKDDDDDAIVCLHSRILFIFIVSISLARLFGSALAVREPK